MLSHNSPLAISTIQAIGSKCGRPVEAYFGIGEEFKLGNDDMVFRNKKGKILPFAEGILKKIKCLEPGAVTFISGAYIRRKERSYS